MEHIIHEVGDYVDIDKLIRNLRELYPEVDFDYENVYTDSVGYLAKLYGDGEELMVVESMGGDPMIRDKKTPAIDKVLGGD